MSYSDSWYTEPMSKHGRKAMVGKDDLKNLDPDQEIYSISGKAPEGYYSAGMVSGGAGYEDHQVFKKLPEYQAPESKKPKSKKDKNKAPKIPGYMDPAKPVQLSNRAAKAEATVSAYNERFDSGLPTPTQAAFDLKDKYALDLKSGVGQRGQGLNLSRGWDNGMSQSFADNVKSKIAENLQPGWYRKTMSA